MYLDYENTFDHEPILVANQDRSGVEVHILEGSSASFEGDQLYIHAEKQTLVIYDYHFKPRANTQTNCFYLLPLSPTNKSSKEDKLKAAKKIADSLRIAGDLGDYTKSVQFSFGEKDINILDLAFKVLMGDYTFIKSSYNGENKLIRQELFAEEFIEALNETKVDEFVMSGKYQLPNYDHYKRLGPDQRYRSFFAGTYFPYVDIGYPYSFKAKVMALFDLVNNTVIFNDDRVIDGDKPLKAYTTEEIFRYLQSRETPYVTMEKMPSNDIDLWLRKNYKTIMEKGLLKNVFMVLEETLEKLEDLIPTIVLGGGSAPVDPTKLSVEELEALLKQRRAELEESPSPQDDEEVAEGSSEEFKLASFITVVLMLGKPGIPKEEILTAFPKPALAIKEFIKNRGEVTEKLLPLVRPYMDGIPFAKASDITIELIDSNVHKQKARNETQLLAEYKRLANLVKNKGGKIDFEFTKSRSFEELFDFVEKNLSINGNLV